MAISFPQVKSGDFTATSTSLAVSLTSGIAAGSIIVVAGSIDGLATDSISFSDGHSDTVTTIIAPTVPSGETALKAFAVAFLAPTTGAQTVTATFSGGSNPGFGDMYVWEVAGLTSPTVDKSPILGGNSATASVSSGTLAAAAEAAIAYSSSGNSSTLIAGNGWTDDGQTVHTGSDGDHQVTASTASLTASWSQGAGSQWDGLIVTFNSGAGATVIQQFLPLLGVGS